MDLEELKDLIHTFSNSNVDKLEFEKEGFELKLVKNKREVAAPILESAPVAALPQAEPVSAATPEPAADDNLITVKSPIVGTYYRAPNPNADPFVEVGGRVRVGQTLCIVEAMKLMNEIQAEHNGIVEKILVENGQAVEYDQPLFLLKPA